MDRVLAQDLLWRMVRVRLVEEAIADEYSAQEMRCPVHLYIGQEAIAAGACAATRDEDATISTHRSHGHYLAKRGNLDTMIAELYGKASGSSGGKGGSMHLFDPQVGYWGSSAIVGGSIPMTVGMALAAQYNKSDAISLAFFGDGATEEGVLYEAMNFAALKHLPVLFICENNQFSVQTRLDERQALADFTTRARSFGIPGSILDGNDVEQVFQVVKTAATRARSGLGPTFIEARTYRWRTHCGPQWDAFNDARTEKELAAWKLRCPIELFKQKSLARGWLTQAQVDEVYENIRREISVAFAAAKASPFPEAKTMEQNVYV